jgi:hypothetical protein
MLKDSAFNLSIVAGTITGTTLEVAGLPEELCLAIVVLMAFGFAIAGPSRVTRLRP